MSSLIKKGDIEFPMRLIAEGGYSSVPNRQQDKNSYVNADGKLNRKILPHTRSGLILTLLDMSQSDKEFVQTFYPKREYVELYYWNDEDNAMKTGIFYVPDIEYTIKSVKSGVKTYKGFTLELIEY